MPCRKKAFSITELMITVVIIAILALIGGFTFSQFMRTQNQKQAQTYLIAIRAAETVYYSNNWKYVSCADIGAINATLGISVAPTSTYNSFSVTVPTNSTTTYTANATGTSTPLSIDQDGNTSGWI